MRISTLISNFLKFTRTKKNPGEQDDRSDFNSIVICLSNYEQYSYKNNYLSIDIQF